MTTVASAPSTRFCNSVKSVRVGSEANPSKTRQYSIHAARIAACSGDSVAGAGGNDSTADGDGLGVGEALADTVGDGNTDGEPVGAPSGVQPATSANAARGTRK
ncbi:hypothetical protein [Tessaracoccus sp. Y1736]